MVKLGLRNWWLCIKNGWSWHWTFSLGDESDGTKRLFDYIPLILDLIQGGKVFIVDEMERSLHPSLIKQIILLFYKHSKMFLVNWFYHSWKLFNGSKDIQERWNMVDEKTITVSVHLDEWIIYIMCVLIKCFKTVTSMANTAQPPYSRQKKR